MTKRVASLRRQASAAEPVQTRIRSFAANAYRETILDAAERLFVSAGYHDARMADLAQAAGVSIGTLYNYFDSKEAVFESLVQRGREELFASLEAVSTSGALQGRLMAIARTIFDYVEQRGALFALYVQMGALTESDIRRVGGDAAEKSYLEFLQLLRRVLSDLQAAGHVRSDLQLDLLVGALAGALNARIYDWVRGGREESLGAELEPLLTLFFEGAKLR